MKDVLGEAATEEVIDAWGEAYNALANIFIETEAKLYKKNDAILVQKLNKEAD